MHGLLLVAMISIAVQAPAGEKAAGVVGGVSAQPGWERLTEHAAFSPRDTAEDAVFNGKMWLSNGYYHGNVLHRDLWASGDGVTWTLINGETPYDGYSELTVFDGKMWAVKGSVWSSSDGVIWDQVLAETPFGARGYGEVVVHNDTMCQLGAGEDVWHSADGMAWTCATGKAPYGKRFASGVTVFNGYLWLMGGVIEKESDPPEKQYPQYTSFNDVWRSRDGAHWERVVEHAPWSPRMWFGVSVYAGRMWVIGGFDNANGANLGDVWWSDDGVHWHAHDAAPRFAPRHEPTVYVFNDALWVVAGNTWPVVNDVWLLTLPAVKATPATKPQQ